TSAFKKGIIRFSEGDLPLDSTAAIYTDKIKITQSDKIQAALFIGNKKIGNMNQQIIRINRATGKEVMLKNPPHPEHNHGGAFSLVNGMTATSPGDWLG